ncbi:hypothetical protein DMN91_012205 [Ooceraea biroi]|uniref:Reverse transcriptase domain-containing protein n=1 Tax=Ooceraea biroi TaxID=2015173 RepID=A0A3L8D4Z4_OOCBI|nr:hypothetical protein DMN91_012205 [Ooceraea biroi]
MELESCPELTDFESLSSCSAADIKTLALRWLGDIDIARVRSGRIEGKLSGQMKKRIDSLKKVVEIMAERVEDVGDVAFLRQRNSELAAQVRSVQPTADKLRKDLAEAERKVRALQEEVDAFKRRIGSRSLSPMPIDVVTREKESPKPQRTERNRKLDRERSANKKKEEDAQLAVPLVSDIYHCDDPASGMGPSGDPVLGPSGLCPVDGASGPADGLAAHLDVLKQYDDRIMTQVEMLLRLRDEIHHGGAGGSSERGGVARDARAHPRIVENVLVVPPSSSVAGGNRDNLASADGMQPSGDNEEWQKITRRRRRPPRTAAVAIRVHSGVKKSYGEVLRQARQVLALETLGITDTRVRRTANGGTLIEIPGPDGANKANLLAGYLRTALEGEALVSRPVVKGELRLSGFDDSVSVDEISALIVDLGGCAHSDIRIGPFRPLNSGLLAVWLQCPLAAATKVAALGRVRANTNRSWRSRDLLMHNLLELEIDVCCVSELQSVPQNNPKWFASDNQLAAIYWNTEKIGAVCTLVTRARDFVAIRCGDLVIFSVYISPTCTTEYFLEALDDLSETFAARGVHLFCGDFNSKSALWGCPATDRRGDILEGWLAQHDLQLSHWWRESVAEARRRCFRARRLWKGSRRASEEIRAERELEYRTAKRKLCAEIKKAKDESWQALLDTIEEDPWGLPYKVVLGRLRRSSPGLTETLNAADLERLLTSSFPVGPTHDPVALWRNQEGQQIELEDVSVTEVSAAMKGRKRGGSPVPGPDGVPLAIWRRAPGEIPAVLAEIFTACLRQGFFPERWKKAILVLIPKGGDLVNSLKARPICLLDDVGKGGFAFGVSLDIRNAFNSLPWPSIRQALEKKGFPAYLRRIIDHYLYQRKIEFIDGNGRLCAREVSAGVPQGSIVGPLLWDITYDYVISMRDMPVGSVLGYVDDTFIIGRAIELEAALSRVNVQPLIKYLGVMLDSRLSFLAHFRYVQGRVGKVTRALGHLMPNLRPSPKETALEFREEESLLMRRQWSLYLNRADTAGSRTRNAIMPHIEGWMSRRHGGPHFHLVQLLTGHGCFSTFLHRIGKLESAACCHCDGGIDYVEHTLQECDAWEVERRELVAIICPDLTLCAVVGTILRNREAWSAFSRFAVSVMRIKEDAERARQAADDPLQVR